MELKLLQRGVVQLGSKFQSYLYGIEIDIKNLYEASRQLFQSYLYGIEIGELVNNRTQQSVSIVPLWNWNINSLRAAYALDSFNRTFMELK